MKELRSIGDVLRRLALANPRKVFETLEDVHGLRRMERHCQPAMLDHDGDETNPDSVFHAPLEGTPVVVAHYPCGTISITVGTECLPVVRRERTGDRFEETWYVYDDDLERYRATGRFGEISGHDPASFLDLLEEHRILEEHSIRPRGETWDADYIRFLREHGASDNVIDG